MVKRIFRCEGVQENKYFLSLVQDWLKTRKLKGRVLLVAQSHLIIFLGNEKDYIRYICFYASSKQNKANVLDSFTAYYDPSILKNKIKKHLLEVHEQWLLKNSKPQIVSKKDIDKIIHGKCAESYPTEVSEGWKRKISDGYRHF